MMSAEKLSDVTQLQIPAAELAKTVDWLRACGGRRCEGVTLWLGRLAGDVAVVSESMIPEQTPIAGEEGIGYFIPPPVLVSINRYLFENGLRLIAQVHSHPTEAFHSEMDDAHAIVTTEGGFSLVVPDFAAGPADLRRWAIYRLREGEWRGLRAEEVEATFAIT